MSKMTTWREQISLAMERAGETWADVQSTTLTEEQADTPFDSGYGGSEGVAFTLWTAKRVYFPAVYDGSEWVESVARNPDGIATSHIGGQ